MIPGIIAAAGRRIAGGAGASSELASSEPSGGLWTPADITTALWLDADDASTITESGGDVSQWDDKSGNARHATQGTGSAQPLYDDDGWPGLSPTLSFGGGDRLLVPHHLDLSATGGLSVFGAVKFNATTNNKGWIGKWDPEDWLFWRNPSSAYQFAVREGSSNVGPTATHDTDPHIMGGVVDPSNKVWLQKDGTETDVAIGAVNGSTEGSLAIGSYFTQSVGVDMNGLISEVIIINGVVSESDRQKIEGYLAHKWGLEANLPGDHPYKADAPTV